MCLVLRAGNHWMKGNWNVNGDVSVLTHSLILFVQVTSMWLISSEICRIAHGFPDTGVAINNMAWVDDHLEIIE